VLSISCSLLRQPNSVAQLRLACKFSYCRLAALHTNHHGHTTSTESPTKCDLPEDICCETPGSLSGDSPGLSGDSTSTLSDDTPKTPSGNAPASKLRSYQPMEEIEPFYRYCAGGYYPVRIGDQFCSSRYRIVHKLGYGISSTIWLARDEHMARYVAIKFAVSALGRPFESGIIRTLWDEEGCTVKSPAGVALVPDILDEFEVEGPEIEGVRWKHQCLVTTAARMSVKDARESSDKALFQPVVAHAIAAQMIQAIAGLHSCGVVQAGRCFKGRTEILWRFVDHTSRSPLGQYSFPPAKHYRRPYHRPAL
jgi:hypothetical protein